METTWLLEGVRGSVPSSNSDPSRFQIGTWNLEGGGGGGGQGRKGREGCRRRESRGSWCINE